MMVVRAVSQHVKALPVGLVMGSLACCSAFSCKKRWKHVFVCMARRNKGRGSDDAEHAKRIISCS